MKGVTYLAFKFESAEELPVVGEDFRVGPHVGQCIEHHVSHEDFWAVMEKEIEYDCSRCHHAYPESEYDVAFCNACEHGEFFLEIEEMGE